MNWTDSPRTRDKVSIVGFHEATRDFAPFSDPDYEIWTLNEEYNFPWIKRTDRHFQLHPRWDFSRTNNLNDPNHLMWLKGIDGPCIYCRGNGIVKVKEETAKCPFCDKGTYKVPEYRKNLPIYMQKEWSDIPNCIRLPLDEITKEFLPGKPYYTSSVAYMLGLAMLMGFKRIEFYGFDMGSDTEYHYQKANFEYWLGLAHSRGFDVVLPGSTILTGKLYGYENMHTGYRQQLEMRMFELNKQFNLTKAEVIKLESQHDILKQLKDEGLEQVEEKLKEVKKLLQKKQALLNFLSGAKTETDNLTHLFEGYMRPDVTSEEIDHPAYEELKYVSVQYVEQPNA